MLQAGGEPNLPKEPFRTCAGGELRAQQLHRHQPVVLQVAGEIDRGHPPAAELPLDPKPAGEDGRETTRVVDQPEFLV